MRTLSIPTLAALICAGSACRDDPPAWVDSKGDNCTVYKKQEYCKSTGEYGARWGDLSNTWDNYTNLGETAATACCDCGGGSSCREDPPGWVDNEGDDCAAYKTKEYCTSTGEYGPGWGDLGDTWDNYTNLGRTALTACCNCGGGDYTCSDDPPGWVDNEGDDCAAYKTKLYCTLSGEYGRGWGDLGDTWDNYTNLGRTAVTACCNCGAGLWPTTTITTTRMVSLTVVDGAQAMGASALIAAVLASQL